MPKKDLVSTAKQYSFLEAEVPRTYVDRNPDPNGTLYAAVSTSGTRPVADILAELNSKFSTTTDAAVLRGLVEDTFKLFKQGKFDDNYDNISRVAPELKKRLIFREVGHIGSSIEEKNIGDALLRCIYSKEKCYHALAFVPNSNRAMILCKAQASMIWDKKTRNNTDKDGHLKKNKSIY